MHSYAETLNYIIILYYHNYLSTSSWPASINWFKSPLPIKVRGYSSKVSWEKFRIWLWVKAHKRFRYSASEILPYGMILVLTRKAPKATELTRGYCQGTPKAFWLEFSMDGHNMSFTVIVTILQKQHQVNKQDIVIIAHEKYEKEFDAKFLYQKKDKIHVISNTSGIVHYHQKLKII
ncbi:hypothetical protein EV424DRAFT_1343919 [Suillus variegatus]|nr:hypothetical protein EV424DRAFT_1343919 [Suillus variegatus]